MLCCIDSNTFIWGIKKQSSPSQVDMIPRAEYLFDWLDTNGHEILIPTIVLAEVLAPEPLEKQAVITDIISKKYRLQDFDIRAAYHYGQLLMNRIEEAKINAKEFNIDNQKMKVDYLIVASAMAAGASCIYSTDSHLKSFGNRVIDIKDLPTLPSIQTDLFSDLPF